MHSNTNSSYWGNELMGMAGNVHDLLSHLKSAVSPKWMKNWGDFSYSDTVEMQESWKLL